METLLSVSVVFVVLLTFVNTVVIALALAHVDRALLKLSVCFEKLGDFEKSLDDLTKVIEQQTRLLEYIYSNFKKVG